MEVLGMLDAKKATAVEKKIHTDRMHRLLLDVNVKEIGIHRNQHRVLMMLAHRDKIISQKSIAEILDITPAAVTGILKKLESDGYIKRSPGEDSRYHEIEITDKGLELVKISRKMFQSTDFSLFDDFTEEELDRYIKCLDKITTNLKKNIEKIKQKEGDQI
jgi:DNA-binding MarR family transcriptional regulator